LKKPKRAYTEGRFKASDTEKNKGGGEKIEIQIKTIMIWRKRKNGKNVKQIPSTGGKKPHREWGGNLGREKQKRMRNVVHSKKTEESRKKGEGPVIKHAKTEVPTEKGPRRRKRSLKEIRSGF